MKMTEKWKERKNHKEDNTDKKVKEKKSVKQKIKESMNKKYLKNGSYSVVISAVSFGAFLLRRRRNAILSRRKPAAPVSRILRKNARKKGILVDVYSMRDR